jgi:predicted nuclease of predicted toxin-antitoxin system
LAISRRESRLGESWHQGRVKVKLDENIPHTVCRRLAPLGMDVDAVLDEGLGGRRDEDVWAAAQVEERFLVTQDLDFSDRRKFAPGTQ